MLQQLLSILTLLPFSITASPLDFFSAPPNANAARSQPPLGANESFIEFADASAVHANILANWPAHHVTTSEKLDEFLLEYKPRDDNETEVALYLEDRRTWVTLPVGINGTVEKRQCDAVWTEHQVEFTHAYWSPWYSISSCVSSGFASVGYEDSISVSYGGGLSIGIQYISASFSFQITYGYAVSESYGCSANVGDQAQLWVRHRMGWARFRRRDCSCWCNDWEVGWVNAPASRWTQEAHQYSCTLRSSGRVLKCEP